MNHQGLRWNVHCVANVALRTPLNLYKRGFKIYDLLVFFFFVVLSATRPRPPLGHTEDRRESRNLTCLLAKSCSDVTTRTMLWICKIYFLFVLFVFINRAAIGRARFIIYPWFNFFFFRCFVCD